jgi:hypothetical protein
MLFKSEFLSGIRTMLPIPNDIAARFDNLLQQREVPVRFRAYYKKWLRYFLDFCQKYPPPEAKSEQVRLFVEKLRTKNQTPQQCAQAAHAISFFFELQSQSALPHILFVTVSVRIYCRRIMIFERFKQCWGMLI